LKLKRNHDSELYWEYLAIDKGGQPTTIITVITDDAGNLINVFPGRLGFKAK